MPPIVAFNFTARDGSNFQFKRVIAPPLPQSAMDAQNIVYKRKLGVRVRSTKYTNEYNCHGLTFAAKLGWFEDVRRMLTCHQYQKIGECINFDVDSISTTHTICRGDVVVYYLGHEANVTHTGVIWSTRTIDGKIGLTILSKWGAFSEYFHRHDKVPIGYGKSIEIWTDRNIT